MYNFLVRFYHIEQDHKIKSSNSLVGEKPCLEGWQDCCFLVICLH
jgi:hypothetical protein